MSDDDLHVTSTTYPLTVDNLPDGPRWEQDGSCWKARMRPDARRILIIGLAATPFVLLLDWLGMLPL